MTFRLRIAIFSLATACAALFGVAACGSHPVMPTTDAVKTPRSLPVLPLPALVERRDGAFTVAADTLILVPDGNADALGVGELLAGYVRQVRGLKLAVGTGQGSGATRSTIVLAIDPQAGGATDEGYQLDVSAQGVRVAARAPAGLYYGAVTLWQLLTPDSAQGVPVTVPAMHIVDGPRFAWRGVMLDVSRHYMPPEFVKQLIDWMALHKLNILHWHLTDDQGWRLEIRKYPRLTEIGAWRTPPEGGARTGGFYTQEQVRDIVRYASARYVTIVPEIDMPGHAQAAIAAYPWLGSHGDRPAVSVDWGVNPYLLNVDERTFGFVADVLAEVMELFPGRYIHVGGDEAIKDQWKASPRVQARMRQLGISTEDALQGYFMQRLETLLAAHGRKLVGWDEIVDAGLPADATVMSWRGAQGAIAAARAGHDVIMAPSNALYFDYLQGDGHDEPPGRPTLITLENVYDFQPLPAELDAAQARHVIGVQANVWTEHMITPQRVEHALFPRMAALAEVAWSPAAARDWQNFLSRLLPELGRYRALGIDYADSAFAMRIEASPGTMPGKATVTLSSQTGFGEIRYTLGGSEPAMDSPRYQAPLQLALPQQVTAAAFIDGRPITPARQLHIDAASLLLRNSDELQGCSAKLPLRLGGPLRDDGTQAVYRVDIMDPCWIYANAPLNGVSRIEVRLGRLPYNFQLGTDARNVVPRPPRTRHGELQIHRDSCDGPLLAQVPLQAHTAAQRPETLSAAIVPQAGIHSVCLFVGHGASGTLWVIDTVQLRSER
ncbi:MAG: carbohydrate-binding protein [Nevskia sp.]|nr:carbohydrate-binding protein [Nevskia sp.]